MGEDIEKLSRKEILKRLIDCYEDDDSSTILKGPNIGKRNKYMELLLHNLEIEANEDLRYSNLRFERQLSHFIRQVKDRDNPIKAFEEELDEWLSELQGREEKEFKLLFPLNFKQVGEKKDSFEVLSHEITRKGFQNWRKFENNDLDQMASHKYKKELPQGIKNSKYSIWELKINAKEPRYAVEEADRILEVLLGKINFSAFYYRNRTKLGEGRYVPKEWSELKPPPVIAVYENDEKVNHFFMSDLSKREKFKLSGTEKKRFNQVYPNLPKLKKGREIDEVLISAFRLFQEGISSRDLDDSFLAFWRGNEVLALYEADDKGDSMGDATKRLQAIFDSKDERLLYTKLNRIKEKRNALSHKEGESRLTVFDRNIAKTNMDLGIDFYLQIKEDLEWSKNDVKFFLEEKSSDGTIQDRINIHEASKDSAQSKVDLLEEWQSYFEQE